MSRFVHVNDIENWMDMEKAIYYTNGDRRWLKDKLVWQRLIGPQDSNDLIFGIAKLPPGEVHLLHHHDDAPELYFVLEGCGRFTVDQEERECSPGTGIYIPAGSKHRVENTGDQTLVFFFAYDRPQYETVLDEKE